MSKKNLSIDLPALLVQIAILILKELASPKMFPEVSALERKFAQTNMREES